MAFCVLSAEDKGMLTIVYNGGGTRDANITADSYTGIMVDVLKNM